MMCNISIMYIIPGFSTKSMHRASEAWECTVTGKKGQNIVHILLIHKILYKVGLTFNI